MGMAKPENRNRLSQTQLKKTGKKSPVFLAKAH
jgi:hypothetical protein